MNGHTRRHSHRVTFSDCVILISGTMIISAAMHSLTMFARACMFAHVFIQLFVCACKQAQYIHMRLDPLPRLKSLRVRHKQVRMVAELCVF